MNQELIGKPRDQGGHETGRHVGQRDLPVRFGCLTGWGAWMDSDMQGGPVDELLDVAVERPALDQLEVEVGRTLEDRVHPSLTDDYRKSVTWTRSTRPAAISVRGPTRPPWSWTED